MATYLLMVTGKRGKWITLAVWILLAALLQALLPQSGQYTDDRAPYLDAAKESEQAALLLAREYPNEQGLPALLVWHRASGLEAADLARMQELVSRLSADPLPHQTFVPPFHRLPAGVLQQLVSEDGATWVIPVFFDASADAGELKSSLAVLEQSALEVFGANPFRTPLDSGQLSVRVTGPAGILIDATALFTAGDFSLTIATFLFVLIVLLLIYRSPILALIPLVGVGFAYALVSPLLGWMGERGWVVYDTQGISIMTVLLFGIGTDYCLFLISRFRQFLKIEEDAWRAVKLALGDKSGAIAMSGLTTVFGLSSLLLADLGPVQRFAVPFVLAILAVMAASLTLVPALLSILGRSAFFPMVPRTPEMARQRALAKGKPVPAEQPGRRLGDRLAAMAVSKARIVTIVTTVVLAVLAGFAIQMSFTYDTLSSFPEDMPSREGFKLIGQSFHPGQLAPVKVIADSGGKSLPIKESLEALGFVRAVSEPAAGVENPHIVALDVELDMYPYSNEAMNVLPELRAAVESVLAAAGLAGNEVWLAGQTAEQYDIRATSVRDAFVLVPVILALIALLVLLYLRSIAAMLYLMATVVVSYFSALGLGWIVIHYILGVDAIQGFIPLYAFIFLGALGVDYNLFMISSIWKKARSMPLQEAIRQGASETGAVINSAGLILAGTFAVLATLPIQILVHFGIITAIGVLIDTFVVRPFLVPAVTAWLGEKSFWPGRPGYSGEAEKPGAVEAQA